MTGKPSHHLTISRFSTSGKFWLLVSACLLIIYLSLYEILLAQEQETKARQEYAELRTTDSTEPAIGFDADRDTLNTPVKQNDQINPAEQNSLSSVLPQDDVSLQQDESVSLEQQERTWRMDGFSAEEITLLEINPDYGGILEIPVLDLQYPIARSQDNEEYLNRTFAGEENPAGCIFLDCGASGDYSDLHTFIFGHNRRDGSMFGSLKKFSQDPTLVTKDAHVYLIWKSQKLTWQIFAFGTAGKGDDTLYSYLSTKTEYQQWLAHVRGISWYDNETGSVKEALAKQQPILTLSTCYGTDHIQNFVVHAVMISITE